ncbi:class I SAM-dependent methyltransferase [Candidatus Pelagibacter sp.]|nr:class I SAM-dependent methyltransferase [Candidatus Pelagibacter sp.]
MIDSLEIDYKKIKSLVSRETLKELETFRKLIIMRNNDINLISSTTIGASKDRHIVDSAQIIDFVDKNKSICTDLGSGAGLPGIVLAIIMKHKNSDMQFNLYEKSYHKSKFLEEVSRKLNLNTKVFNQNIFEQENLNSEIIVARAFKPMIVILDLVNKSFKKFNNIILLLGKNGKSSIKECQKKWQFDYVEKNSLTNEESLMIKISNLKKNEK